MSHVPSTLHFCQIPHLGASLAVQLYLLSTSVRSLHLISFSPYTSPSGAPSQRVESLSAPVPKPGSLLLFPPWLLSACVGLSFSYHTSYHKEDVCTAWLSQDSAGILQLRIQFINPSIPGAQHRAQGPVGAYWKVCATPSTYT